MFKGNNKLNKTYGTGTTAGTDPADGAGAGAPKRFRKAFLHNSFLLLKHRLSRTFSFARRSQVGGTRRPYDRSAHFVAGTNCPLNKCSMRAQIMDPTTGAPMAATRCSYCEPLRDPQCIASWRHGAAIADSDAVVSPGRSRQWRKQKGGNAPGWTKREVLNDGSVHHFVEQVRTPTPPTCRLC